MHPLSAGQSALRQQMTAVDRLRPADVGPSQHRPTLILHSLAEVPTGRDGLLKMLAADWEVVGTEEKEQVAGALRLYQPRETRELSVRLGLVAMVEEIEARGTARGRRVVGELLAQSAIASFHHMAAWFSREEVPVVDELRA